MNYTVNHIPVMKKRRSGRKVTMTSITIHSTANPRSTAINERNWLVNPSNTRSASWHIAVDERGAVEAIPLNEEAYHAGKSEGNRSSISVEMCESGNREKTIQNTVSLVAKMLHERRWGIDRLRRHYDWSGKNCPRILNYNHWEGWSKFKKDVQKELENIEKSNYKDGIDMSIKKWQSEMGKDALESLDKKKDNFGQPIVSDPKGWKDKLDQDVPQWLFWSIIDRITK